MPCIHTHTQTILNFLVADEEDFQRLPDYMNLMFMGF